MTQPSLVFDAPPADTYTAKAVAIFRAHPDTWLHWSIFAEKCGALAWRTRISECRKLGMTIQNRIERDEFKGIRHSYYRWQAGKAAQP